MKTKLNAPRSVGSTSSAAASTDRSGRAASSAVTNAVSEVTPGSARPSSATRRASSAVLTRLPLCARAIVMPAHCSAYGVVVADLARRYPFLPDVCRFTAYQQDLLDLLGHDELREPPDRAFICDDNEERALKAAITADRFWRGAPDSVVVRLDQLAALRERLNFGGSLKVYGVVDAASDPELIGEDLVGRLARVIHDRYRMSRWEYASDPAARPFTVAWEELPAQIQLANRALAEDIWRKLRAVGCVLVPRGGYDESVLGEAEIDTLAVMEHERWRKEHADDGWRYAERRDDVRKLHPAICDWGELSEHVRQHNQETVRGLPAILSDAGFQIVRG